MSTSTLLSFLLTVIPSGLLSFLPYQCHSFQILSFLPNYSENYKYQLAPRASYTQRVRKMATRGGHICEYVSISFSKIYATPLSMKLNSKQDQSTSLNLTVIFSCTGMKLGSKLFLLILINSSTWCTGCPCCFPHRSLGNLVSQLAQLAQLASELPAILTEDWIGNVLRLLPSIMIFTCKPP